MEKPCVTTTPGSLHWFPRVPILCACVLALMCFASKSSHLSLFWGLSQTPGEAWLSHSTCKQVQSVRESGTYALLAACSQGLAGVEVWKCLKLASSRKTLRAICTPGLGINLETAWNSTLIWFLSPSCPAPLLPFSWKHLHSEWLEHAASSLTGPAPREPDPSQPWLQLGQCLCLRLLHLELGGRELVRGHLLLLLVGNKEADPQKAAETALTCHSPASSCPSGISGPLQGVAEIEDVIQVVQLCSAIHIHENPNQYHGDWRALRCYRCSLRKTAQFLQTVHVVSGVRIRGFSMVQTHLCENALGTSDCMKIKHLQFSFYLFRNSACLPG